MDKFSFLQSTICEKFVDNELSANKAIMLLEAIEDQMYGINHTITEGANIEYRKEFKEAKKKFKESVKKLKSMVKKADVKDKKAFDEELEKAHKALDESEKAINTIPSTVVSSAISWLVISIIDNIKWFIPTLATLGLAELIPAFQELIDLFTGIGKGIRGEEDWIEALNLLRQRYGTLIKRYHKILDRIKTKYEKSIVVKESTFDIDNILSELDI